MVANIGSIDRVLRIVLGIGLLSMLVFVDGPSKFWGLIGIVPLATAAMRFCPLYAVLGVRTCQASH